MSSNLEGFSKNANIDPAMGRLHSGDMSHLSSMMSLQEDTMMQPAVDARTA